MDDFNFEEEPKPFEPVHLKGFSRYLFYPEGTCWDTKMKRWLRPNRFMNFAMFPDEPKYDEKGKETYVVDNMRQIIAFLVKAKIPGFEKELPPYIPPPLYEPLNLVNGEVKLLDDSLPRALKLLKKRVVAATDALLEDLHNLELQEKYKQAKMDIDAFKADNPDYYKWPVFKEVIFVDPFVEKALLEEEESLNKELAELDAKITAIRKRLIGVLDVMGFYKRNENQKGHGLTGRISERWSK